MKIIYIIFCSALLSCAPLKRSHAEWYAKGGFSYITESDYYMESGYKTYSHGTSYGGHASKTYKTYEPIDNWMGHIEAGYIFKNNVGWFIRHDSLLFEHDKGLAVRTGFEYWFR